ncbi:MAG: serine/threonine-protein kinase [Planctomycetes bacterium]|nr:serine/threonine-protein kinase [Planctomycetota bacterium]
MFADVCQLPSTEWAAYLEQVCRDDVALRREVAALLEHDDKTLPVKPRVSAADMLRGDLLDARAIDDSSAGAALAGASDTIPERIGRYRIIRRIGVGGMGVVFEGEQDNPRRTIALKVIRPGFVSEQLLRRFATEAHILGRLHHPGIAQVYEAGTAPVDLGGSRTFEQPFFAMEFIRGRPLDQVSDDQAFSIRQRLDLFVKICDAVQHAHQKGVIHRDLKPGNILVDDIGQPKILDFGVARVTNADVQVTTLHTNVGQLIDTIPYMSPEQIAGDSRELDTRSDVYALGVLLYRLLSGRLPHDLRGKAIPEAARTITEDDPTPLSAFNRVFRGDLDTIVSKALEKDRDRRYQSAVELGTDVRRYLSDQPIVAHPPTTLYQLRKFARRNKALVGGITIAFVTLLVATGVTTWQAIRATRQRDRAQAAEQLAQQRSVETATQATKANAIRRFLEQMLASVDPATARDRDTVLLHELLANAVQRVELEFADQPEVQADLHGTIGRTYLTIGAYAEAETHTRRALDLQRRLHGDSGVAVAAASADVGGVLTETGPFSEANDLFQQALELYRRQPEQHDCEIALIFDRLAHIDRSEGRLTEAEARLREARVLLRAHLPDDHPSVAQNAEALGVMLAELGRYQEAEELFRQNLAYNQQVHTPPHPGIATALLNLGVVLRSLSRYDESTEYLEQAVAMRRELFGRHKTVGLALSQLAETYTLSGAAAEAEAALREALDIARAVLPPEHPDVRQRMMQLGKLLSHQRKYNDAEALLREALALEREHGGATRLLASGLHSLGHVLRVKGHYQEAATALQEALATQRQLFKGPHPAVASTLGALGSVLVDLGKYDEAEQMLTEVLTMTRSAVGNRHPAVAAGLDGLATLYLRRGMLDQAKEFYSEALATKRDLFGDRHVEVMVGINNLALVYSSTGAKDQAEQMYREALALSRELLGNENLETATILANLASVLHNEGQVAEAESMYRDSLAMESKLRGEQHPSIANTQTKLAGLLRSTGRAAEAEPLAREALATLRARVEPTNAYVPATLKELGRTLLDLNRPAEAEPYLRECLELQQRNPQPKADKIFTLRKLLANALAAQEKFDEAEELLLANHAAASAGAGDAHADTLRTIESLIKLYEAWGKPAEAAAWQAKLPAPSTGETATDAHAGQPHDAAGTGRSDEDRP